MVALLSILLAARLVWVPMHLAQEPHEYGLGHVRALVHGEHERGEHVHEHGDGQHGHESKDGRDHHPHPAADHQTDVIGREVSQDPGIALILVGHLSSISVPEPSYDLAPWQGQAIEKPPPPRSSRARAPPAV